MTLCQRAYCGKIKLRYTQKFPVVDTKFYVGGLHITFKPDKEGVLSSLSDNRNKTLKIMFSNRKASCLNIHFLAGRSSEVASSIPSIDKIHCKYRSYICFDLFHLLTSNVRLRYLS